MEAMREEKEGNKIEWEKRKGLSGRKDQNRMCNGWNGERRIEEVS